MKGKGKGKGKMGMFDMMDMMDAELMFKGKGKGKGPMGGLFGKGMPDDDDDDDEDEDEDDDEDEDEEKADNQAKPGWEIDLDSHWAPFDPETARAIAEAEAAGETTVQTVSRGFLYIIDLEAKA